MMRASGYPGKAMVTMMIGAVINVVLDPIFIFVFDMGIKGAAIGSTLAGVVSFVVFVVYMRLCIDRTRYGLNRLPKLSMHIMKLVLRISSWTMVQNFISISTWFVFFLFVEHTGERSLAVSNIVRSISGLVWMILIAFASTGSTLVSNLIGHGNNDGVIALTRKVLKFTYMVILPLLVVISLMPEPFIMIYTDIAELVPASVPSLWVLCASYLLSIPAIVYFQAVSGTGNAKSAFALELVALLVYVVYCYVVIELMRSDVAVCWTAEAVYAAVMVIMCRVYLWSGHWRGKMI